MSIRINKAKNFKGKAYVAADELDNLIQTMTFGTALTGTSVDGWKVKFQYADQNGNETKTTLDLTAIKEYIDSGIADKAITVKAGAGIKVGGDDATQPTISADVDGTTIVLSGEGDDAKLATGLKLKKLDTATTGYAASYQLTDKDGTAIAGSTTIDIVKDQFIGSAKFGWADTANSNPSTWSETKPESGTVYPCIEIKVWTNTDGNAETSETTLTPLYIPLNDVFTEYTARNGVTITNDNIIEGVVDTANSEKVFTGKNTSASVLEVGADGFKVANIQAAIDNAVTAEHNAASAAIEDLEGDVKNFASNTSAAVTTLNTRIETVATNAQTAAGNAQANAIAYAAGVADNAQSAVQKVGSEVDALDTRVSTAIESVNTNVEGAIGNVITNVNTAINANVTAVNTNVGSAVASVNEMVSGSVDSVNSAVTTFKETVNATVETVSAAMTSLAGDVNDAVAARSTQLTNAVEVVDTPVTIAPADYTANSGVITKTVEAKYILAVYDASGNQIYPEITRGTTATNGVYTFTLEADYGESTEKDAQWNVICVKPLPNYSGSAVAVTGYSNTIAYTGATKAADATYAPVEKVGATAVAAEAVTYTKGTAVAATTVDKGTPGNGVTSVDKGTAATAPATGGIDVTKEPPSYRA